MIIRNEIKRLVSLLHFDRRLDHPKIIPKMRSPGGFDPRQRTFFFSNCGRTSVKNGQGRRFSNEILHSSCKIPRTRLTDLGIGGIRCLEKRNRGDDAKA